MPNEPLDFDVPPEMVGFVSPKTLVAEVKAILFEEGRMAEVSEGEVIIVQSPEQPTDIGP